MDQGTEEWLSWRRKGVGASDVACLMGELEYNTPYKLWLEKTGQSKSDDWASRGAFAKGHENEKRIRAAYEFDEGEEFPPAQFENPDHPEIRASLDGWCEKLWKGCEIKFVGKQAFEDKFIKRSHFLQMQYQMLVTKATTWDYVMSDDGVRSYKKTIEAEPELQKEMLNKVVWFWGMVLNKTAPPYTEMDWIPVENEMLEAVLDCIKSFKAGAKMTPAEKKQLQVWRDEVFGMVKNARTICAGAKILKTEKMKSIKFEEAADVAESNDQGKADGVSVDKAGQDQVGGDGPGAGGPATG